MARSAGRGAMVGCIKARPFEYYPYRRVNLAQLFFAALGTPGQRGLAEFLGSIELHSAILTTIGIYRHSFLPQRANKTKNQVQQECIVRLFGSNRKVN